MGIDYVAEKFYAGVLVLATSNRPLRERIRLAWDQVHRVRAEDLTGELREAFTELEAEITRHDGPQGSMTASANQMTDDEARQHAEKIVHIFLEVAPYFYGMSHLRELAARSNDSAT